MRYLTWKTYVTGATALFFVATRPVSRASAAAPPRSVAPDDREVERLRKD
jgi:hypothetical protein